ncbi:MAG: FHA domain-containing protein [Cyanobacteria bacterium WB6_1B_304]|nr:FHA domain-containing protein [Cyanobacteria bacterium WB6_1B_304]
MIVCPNCNHHNPDGATQCEACFTPLPSLISCPSCGASVQSDINFCGQCGSNIQASTSNVLALGSSSMPDLVPPDPLVIPDPILKNSLASPSFPPMSTNPPANDPSVVLPSEATIVERPISPLTVPVEVTPPPEATIAEPPNKSSSGIPVAPVVRNESKTQLQQLTANLIHIQTNTQIELPRHLTVVHIGKPNDRIPPDIDVSGFANSDIVSRIHADIRLEGGIYYIEDVGSSNGTYINNLPLSPGNRHRLRPGDRISFGKGDLVVFLFQSA